MKIQIIQRERRRARAGIEEQEPGFEEESAGNPVAGEGYDIVPHDDQGGEYYENIFEEYI